MYRIMIHLSLFCHHRDPLVGVPKSASSCPRVPGVLNVLCRLAGAADLTGEIVGHEGMVEEALGAHAAQDP